MRKYSRCGRSGDGAARSRPLVWEYDRIGVELAETVTCEACGLERVSLQTHLRKEHGFEAGEYKQEYPHAFVHAEVFRARLMRHTKTVIPHWEPLWSPEYILDRVSHLHETGEPVNLKSIDNREPALAGISLLLIGNWDTVLERAGLDPREIRIVAKRRRLTADQVLETIRDRHRLGLSLASSTVCQTDTSLWSASYRLFGSYRRALEAAGFNPQDVLLTRRHDEEEQRSLLERARVVVRLSGERHRRELDALHRDFGQVVYRKYGGWRDFAERFDLPRNALMRQGAHMTEGDVLAALRERKRDGRSLGARRIHVEDSTLYYAVVRHFGTFEDCYELLGYPKPPIAPTYRPAFRDPAVLLKMIREAARRAPDTPMIGGSPVVGYARLAWLARRHFGSWDRALRLAGVTRAVDAMRYADPRSVRDDLSRVVEGRRIGDDARRHSLFLHVHRLHGSVLTGFMSAGMTRDRAMSMNVSPHAPYTSGQRVVREIARRKRAGMAVTYERVENGSQKDLPLMNSARLIFGSWTAALEAANVRV